MTDPNELVPEDDIPFGSPRPSHWGRKRAAEKLRAGSAADLAAAPVRPKRPVDELRQMRRTRFMSARVQRRARKAVRRGRDAMSRAERHARGMQ